MNRINRMNRDKLTDTDREFLRAVKLSAEYSRLAFSASRRGLVTAAGSAARLSAAYARDANPSLWPMQRQPVSVETLRGSSVAILVWCSDITDEHGLEYWTFEGSSYLVLDTDSGPVLFAETE